MRRKREPEWTEFSMEIDGKIHKGQYYVKSGMVTARMDKDVDMRELCTQGGGGTALGVARMLLRELVGGKAKRSAD